MTLIETMSKITPLPILSILIWALPLLLFLFLARKFFYYTIRALARVIRNALRFAAASILIAEKWLARRNREVLIAKGLENVERKVEREFHHINSAVARNLSGYPTLHLRIAEVITKLEEDHRQSMDVPPSLPNWKPIIEAIAGIEHSGDTMVSGMLSEINHTLEKQHAGAIENYRNSSKARHGILNGMLPAWVKLQKTLKKVDKSLVLLTDRAKRIDQYMDEYREIQAKTDKAVQMISFSSLTQFFVSGLFLIIALGGAVLNFHLIALPMSEMVGGGSYIGSFKTAEVAAMVITAVQLSLGLFLMESLGVTRLFPIIGCMDGKMRLRMTWITLTLLIIFAGFESALSVLRNQMVADMEALGQLLAGAEQTGVSNSMIPTVGQIIIGFILPFWIAFGAIPLASFISSARTILGYIAAGSLRVLAFLLGLSGNIIDYSSKLILTIYDLVIFPTLWLEGFLTDRLNKGRTPSKPNPGLGFLKKTNRMLKNEDQSIELK